MLCRSLGVIHDLGLRAPVGVKFDVRGHSGLLIQANQVQSVLIGPLPPGRPRLRGQFQAFKPTAAQRMAWVLEGLNVPRMFHSGLSGRPRECQPDPLLRGSDRDFLRTTFHV